MVAVELVSLDYLLLIFMMSSEMDFGKVFFQQLAKFMKANCPVIFSVV